MSTRLTALAIFGGVALLLKLVPVVFTVWSGAVRDDVVVVGGAGNLASTLLLVQVVPFAVLVSLLAYATGPSLSARAETGSSGWVEGGLLYVTAELLLFGLTTAWEAVGVHLSGTSTMRPSEFWGYTVMVLIGNLMMRWPIAAAFGAFAGSRFFSVVRAA